MPDIDENDASDTTDAPETETSTDTGRKRRRGYVPAGAVPIYDAESNHTGFVHYSDIIAVDADPETPNPTADGLTALLVMISRHGCQPVTLRTYTRSMGHFLAHFAAARRRAHEQEMEERAEAEAARGAARTKWALALVDQVLKIGKDAGIFGGGGYGGEGEGEGGFGAGGCGGTNPPIWPAIPRKVGPPVMPGDDLYPFAFLLHADDYNLWHAYGALVASLAEMGATDAEVERMHSRFLFTIGAGEWFDNRVVWLEKHRELIASATIEQLRALVETPPGVGTVTTDGSGALPPTTVGPA